jgi:hypothetical protein
VGNCKACVTESRIEIDLPRFCKKDKSFFLVPSFKVSLISDTSSVVRFSNNTSQPPHPICPGTALSLMSRTSKSLNLSLSPTYPKARDLLLRLVKSNRSYHVPRIETHKEQLIRRKDLATQPIHPTKMTRPHHRHRHAFTVSSMQSPTQVTVSISSEQDKIYEPTNYAETIHSPDANFWKAAIQD